MPYVNRLMRRRGLRGFGDSAWVQPDCGGTLVPTGNPLSPCVMPGSPLPGGGNASNGGGGTGPVGSKVSFSCDSSQGALNQFQNNTPVVNNATVNGSPDSGWVVGSPLPTYSPASSSPASSTVAPVLNLSPAGSPASSALLAAQASVAPSSSSTDWLAQSMLGGVPNWALAAGAGVGALMLLMSMGGHR